jgi:hypothetical protein
MEFDIIMHMKIHIVVFLVVTPFVLKVEAVCSSETLVITYHTTCYQNRSMNKSYLCHSGHYLVLSMNFTVHSDLLYRKVEFSLLKDFWLKFRFSVSKIGTEMYEHI